MPRIRYLKPEFFSDEDLCSLPYQTRLAFAGLWCYADKSGILEDRPKFLKVSIFPYDSIDMEKQLQALTRPKPFIHRYETEGKRYIQIISWHKHQKPHHTEKDSIFPPVPPLNTKEKGMEKGMGMEKQLEASVELRNGETTVKKPLSYNSKKSFGEFKNILLTEEEYQKLVSTIGEKAAHEEIENLSRGIESKGYKYKSHYATILNWNRRYMEEKKKTEGKYI